MWRVRRVALLRAGLWPTPPTYMLKPQPAVLQDVTTFAGGVFEEVIKVR